MIAAAFLFKVLDESKDLTKFPARLDCPPVNAGHLKLNGIFVRFPSLLNSLKKLFHTTVILLVSKLHAGRLLNNPILLKSRKKLFPTVVILLVSKLPLGKLVKNPP